MDGTKCTAVQYLNNASVCYPYLVQYKSCIPSLRDKDGVYISSRVSVQQSEDTANQLNIFKSFLSSQCQLVAFPFLCLSLFPLCDGNHTTYLPSNHECNSISTDTCKEIWKMAATFISNLPVCSALPNTSPCNREWITILSLLESVLFIYSGTAHTGYLHQTAIMSTNCSENFIFTGNQCLPACPDWSLSDAEGPRAVVVLSAVVGLIGGIFVFLLSGLRFRKM